MRWRAQPLAFERAGDCGLEIGPCDEESRATGALTAAANVHTGTNGERCEEQAIGDASNGDRVNGDNVTDSLEIGSSMPRGEANVAMAATVEIEARRDIPHNGSPARRHAPPLNGDEANAPGAPQPPRRSAQRSPCAQAPVRAADPRSGAGSDQQQPAEQQGRLRQDAREEVDEERVRSPWNIRGQERQADPSDQREGGARSASGRRGGGRTADRGGRAAGLGERARGGGPKNVYLQALEMYGMGNWGEIAEHVGCKSSMAQLPASPLQCSSLSPPASCPSPPCTHQALEMYGMGNWGEIVEHVGSKSKSQCHDHYLYDYLLSPTGPLHCPDHYLYDYLLWPCGSVPESGPLPVSRDLSHLRTQAETEAAKAAMEEKKAAETDLSCLRTQADTEAATAAMEEQEAAETANLSPTLISLLRAPTLVPLPFSLQDLSRLRTQADTEAAKAAMQEQEAAETVGLASTRNFYLQGSTQGGSGGGGRRDCYPPLTLLTLFSASCVPPVSPPLQNLTRLRTQADTEAAKVTMEEQEAAETANLSPTLISLLRAPAPVPLPLSLSLQDRSRLRTQADTEAAKAAMEEQEAAEITVDL
ncbi:unnamed protein product [Closterium sp. NIES-65]|nr:unnamed protein product [Closterium sp. NIES-65]